MRRRDLLIGSLALPFTSRRLVDAQATPELANRWARAEWFASPDWIAERLDVADVRIVALTPFTDFEWGHIPGAVQIDWPELELVDSAEATIADWRADVEAKLTALGVTRGSTVVVYDGGTFYAARLWWVLHLLGHEDTRILDGGFPAWTDAGGQIERGVSRAGSTASDPYAGTPNDEALARIDDVAAAVDNGAAMLVDARSADEFRKGRIPGAVNIPFTDNALPDSGGRWKAPADLRGMYAASGITTDKLVIPYCSTGVRSANTYFTLRALGYPEVKLYSASYAEWSSDPNRPIETSAG